MEGLKRTRIQSKTEQALDALYVFRNNAFIDWMQQADDADKAWAKGVFVPKNNQPSWEWVVRSADCVEMVNGIGSVCLQYKRDCNPNGTWAMQRADTFPLLLYMWSRDNSANALLSKNMLTMIYGVLHSPADMRAFMQVNRRWRQAALEYQGYEAHVQRMVQLSYAPPNVCPLKMEGRPMFQRFFALSFVSCMTDEQLSRRVYDSICHKGNDALIIYVQHLAAELLPKGGAVIRGLTEPPWYDPHGMRQYRIVYRHPHGDYTYLLLEESTFFLGRRRCATLPLAEMRDIVCNILFRSSNSCATASYSSTVDLDSEPAD